MKFRSKFHLFTSSYLLTVSLLTTYFALSVQIELVHIILVTILILIGLLLTLAEKRLSNLADIIKRHLKKTKSQTNSIKKENPDEIIS